MIFPIKSLSVSTKTSFYIRSGSLVRYFQFGFRFWSERFSLFLDYLKQWILNLIHVLTYLKMEGKGQSTSRSKIVVGTILGLILGLEPIKKNLYFQIPISSFPLNVFEFRAEIYSSIKGHHFFIFTISNCQIALKISDRVWIRFY